jgi:hypothetical protein
MKLRATRAAAWLLSLGLIAMSCGQGGTGSISGANKHMVWETLAHAGTGWAGLR